LKFYVGMNFLHFAVLMFVICVGVLLAVSLVTPAPANDKVADLTFETSAGSVTSVEASGWLGKLPMAAALVLIVTVISLWVYFA